MKETKIVRNEYILTRKELLEKLGIKGTLEDIDIMRLGDEVLLRVRPED